MLSSVRLRSNLILNPLKATRKNFARDFFTTPVANRKFEKISKIADLRRMDHKEVNFTEFEMEKEHILLGKSIDKVGEEVALKGDLCYIGTEIFVDTGKGVYSSAGSKHPPKIGRHGTSSKHEKSLLRGLKLQEKDNHGGRAQLGEGFYVAAGEHEEEIAKHFAEQAMDSANEGLSDKPHLDVILKVRCSNFKKLKGLVIPHSMHWANKPWKAMESHGFMIKEFDYIASFIHLSATENQFLKKKGLDTSEWIQIKFNPHMYKDIKITH